MMNIPLRRLLLLLVVLISPVVSTGIVQAQPASDLSRISRAEIEGATDWNAYELVQRLRPQWLSTRSGSGAVVVFFDNARLGSPEQLRDVPLHIIGSIQYLGASRVRERLNPVEARGVVGVIIVASSRREERRPPRPSLAGDSKQEFRFTLSILPLGASLGGPSDQLEGALTSDGWTYESDHTPRSPSSAGKGAPVLLGIGYNASPRVAVELIGGRVARATTLGLKAASVGRIEAAYGSTFAAGLLGYRFGAARLGAGPMMAQTNWSWTSNASSRPAEEWRTSALGVMLDGSARLALTSRLFAEARGQHHLLEKTEVKGFHSFPGAEVSLTRLIFGLAFGIGF